MDVSSFPCNHAHVSRIRSTHYQYSDTPLIIRGDFSGFSFLNTVPVRDSPLSDTKQYLSNTHRDEGQYHSNLTSESRVQ